MQKSFSPSFWYFGNLVRITEISECSQNSIGILRVFVRSKEIIGFPRKAVCSQDFTGMPRILVDYQEIIEIPSTLVCSQEVIRMLTILLNSMA